jgi:hypothetical protein
MARPAGNPFLKLDHTDLAYAVQRLVALGKLKMRDVMKLADERGARVAELERELQALRGASLVRRGPGRPPGSGKKQRAFTKSAKYQSARKKQGRYLGLRRGLPPAEQQRATQIAQSKGVDAALKFIEAARKKLAA